MRWPSTPTTSSHGLALLWFDSCLWLGVLFLQHPSDLPHVVAVLSPRLLVPLPFLPQPFGHLHLHWNTLLLRKMYFAWETVTPAHLKCIQCPSLHLTASSSALSSLRHSPYACLGERFCNQVSCPIVLVVPLLLMLMSLSSTLLGFVLSFSLCELPTPNHWVLHLLFPMSIQPPSSISTKTSGSC